MTRMNRRDIFTAIHANDLPALRAAIKAGANGGQEDDGRTPLDRALSRPSSEEIIDLFRLYAPGQVVAAFCAGPGQAGGM